MEKGDVHITVGSFVFAANKRAFSSIQLKTNLQLIIMTMTEGLRVYGLFVCLLNLKTMF